MDGHKSDGPATGAGGLRMRHLWWILLMTVLVSVAATYWVVRSYIYPKDFSPVTLSAQEQVSLGGKLRRLGYAGEGEGEGAASTDDADQTWLAPVPYAEDAARRELVFSERELNALIANNPDLARKLALSLSDNLVSARMLLPLDPDFPVLGGKTLRLSAGVEMEFKGSRPVVVLRGVTVMGVPVPNAWLGGLKHIDLIQEFGDQQGFWSGFADGVEDMRVTQGQLRIRLAE